MDVDDVVDLSISRDSVSLSNATVRDLRVLTQNAGLTITPAPPSVNNGSYIALLFAAFALSPLVLVKQVQHIDEFMV